MEAGTITEWLLEEGDDFEVDDPLYEVETDKSATEVTATVAGRLIEILVPAGEDVPVGSPIARIDVKDDAAIVREPGAVPEGQPAESGQASDGDLEQDRPKEQVASVAMPRARRRANELGVDLSEVQGTGRSGAVTVEDVEAAAGDPGTADDTTTTRPLGRIARRMAENVSRSWSEVPQFQQVVQVDASRLVALRSELRDQILEEHSVELSYTALIIMCVAQAATEVPEANATYEGDSLLIHEQVNVGVATDTPGGLVVPVLQDVQNLDPASVAIGLSQVSDRAREGNLRPQDLEGATITVSNLGMFGIDSGTPLVPAPQSTITFLGAIQEVPVVIDGEIKIRPTMKVCSAFDHRVLDGATAARYSIALRNALEAL